MFQSYNSGVCYSPNNTGCDDYSANTTFENSKVLNSKIYYLNNSSTKFLIVGLSLSDFSPKIVIGGKNGFSICLSEHQWQNFLEYQGVVANYFHSDKTDSYPIKFSDITLVMKL